MQEFEEDWTLITGATTGKGYQAAKILASRGRNLVLVCCNEERLCQVARELNEISDIIIMPMDMSREGSSLALFNECERLGLKINLSLNFAQENT